ncbi:ABC transporter ATP-binding protein [Cohnella lupini]|uniref:ABC-type multidrug transport system fused ATPase/permease subunit n=1 Tax=Cohnella lupini TaxID=1294267 RepID=A0A3D9IWS0_9BACL|nr:ABC transporter ATP-binding protein [Cohnella lupini]RED66258.1 ABC-type multidrug transport system fused ATPase/permease subunit [Cohnella lupini]
MKEFRMYFRFVKPYRWLVAFTLLIGMVKFAIPLAVPLFLQYAVDDILLAELSKDDKISRLIELIIISFFLFVIVRYPIEYFRQYFAQLTTSKILFDLRNKLYGHLQRLSLRFYQERKSGEIISRMMNDAEQTKAIVETGMMNVWLDLFTLTIAIVIMLNMNATLTLVAILILPFYGIAVVKLYKRLKTFARSRSAALADMQGYLNEHVVGIPVVKSFTLEQYERKQFGVKNGTFLEKALALTKWNALTNAIINTLTEIAPLLILLGGGYLVIMGELTIGGFVAFYGYLDRLYTPLRRLVSASTELTQASASLERVMELLNEPQDIMDGKDAKPLRKVTGRIEFDNVFFRYRDETDWVLRDIRLTIEPGQTVAFVGMSGGGKSSLISLLPRFYDIQQGAIRIDEQDISRVTQHSLRSQIGMVLQDNILFSGSVRENIMLGNPDESESHMLNAAKRANAHDFIMSLPQGYETEIGERGVKLSGGQKQRIAIARVFLKDPAILVLDEATSALDLESEHLIQESLQALTDNRTTLVVAHRLSTITHADQIIVIERGEIVERGKHEQLMEQGGAYARLYNVQNL